MSARYLVGRDSKTLARHPPLERGWQEPIIAPHENAGWHGRPRLERAGGAKHGSRLMRFALRPGVVKHRLWYVMEKVDARLERSIGPATVAHVLSALRLTMASIFPPLTRGLAGLRDHRIDQHQHGDSRLCTHERHREAGQRLRDQDHALWIPIANRADDGC